MWHRIGKVLLVAAVAMSGAGCARGAASKESKSPLDELPEHITRLTHFGQRADWSGDGKRILFVEKTFGDVYEIDLETKIIRAMTHRYFHEGYTRALYLSNGDILLSGARRFDASNPWPSRDERNAELWVLKKDLSGPPVALGVNCSEGPAVSRKRMHIVWTYDEGFYSADIVYEKGEPKLANTKRILDKKDLPFETGLEAQNLRPPDEKEVIFSAYGYQGTEVCGYHLETGKVVNYSNAPGQYDEPEGIFPDGRHTLVECDKHSQKGTQHIDLYKLALDGSGETKRMTFFSDYPGYKASNPAVSDDGRYIAFQMAKQGDPAGVGRGVFIFDIEKFEQESEEGKVEAEPNSIETRIDKIEADYGVKIHRKFDRVAFFPKKWLEEPISGQGRQMSAEEVQRVVAAAARFLSEYPKEVLEANLTDIYLVSGLEFYGKACGAAYGKSALYVNSDGPGRGYSEQFLLSQMHSELSSIFLINYKDDFSEDAWQAANADGWEYKGTGVEMLGQPDIFAQAEELLDRGFLVKYSQSSLENDVNMFAFWAFTRPKKLQELASKYERIGLKYRLMVQFYAEIGPGIDIETPREASSIVNWAPAVGSSRMGR